MSWKLSRRAQDREAFIESRRGRPGVKPLFAHLPLAARFTYEGAEYEKLSGRQGTNLATGEVRHFILTADVDYSQPKPGPTVARPQQPPG